MDKKKFAPRPRPEKRLTREQMQAIKGSSGAAIDPDGRTSSLLGGDSNPIGDRTKR